MVYSIFIMEERGFEMNYDCIDITSFYNNKMIFSGYDEATSCTLVDYFVNNCFEGIDSGKIPFLFPVGTETNHLQYDNMSCEGQIINLNNRLCKSIHCVGFCEWGDMRGELTLSCQNGTVRHSDIFFYDWYRKSEDSFLYDVKDENCFILNISKTMKGKKALYLYTIHLGFDNERLNTIQVPYIPNMHIFSITLEY